MRDVFGNFFGSGIAVYDIGSDEGDGHSVMEITMQYDDVLPDIYNGVENIIGNTSPTLGNSNQFRNTRNILGTGLTGG